MGMGLRLQTKEIFLLGVLIVCNFVVDSAATAQTIADALDTTNLVWTTGGDVAWFAQTTNTHDGIDAVRSGVLGTNQTSWVETTVTGTGTVSYWTMTGSSTGYYIGSSFEIIGKHPERYFTRVYLDGVWHKETNDLYEGENILRWTASDYWGNATDGFVALDEFAVAPPRALAITYQPGDATEYSGWGASFSVDAWGTPPYQYQWMKDGTNIADATNAWFSIETATTNDSGNYSVIVSNAHEFVLSRNALFAVLPPAAPFFNQEPASGAAYSGQNVYLDALINGSPPFTYYWYKNETNLVATGQVSQAGWGINTLVLTNISAADGGSYSVVVSNAWGGVKSSNAFLSVIQTIAPVFTRHPRSLEVAEGVNTWLSAEAAGTPDPTFKWMKVGELPPPPNPFPPFPPTFPSFPSAPGKAFWNVSGTNAGIYFATAGNYDGEVESRKALLTVLPPIAEIGSWWQGGEDVFVTNGLAFLAQGTSGVSILDIHNPAAPASVGGYNTAGYAYAVRATADLAFVADGSSGLQVLNITNPLSPILIGNYNSSGSAYDLTVRSNLVYVADGNSGLLILDVSHPSSPSFVGSYATNLSARHIALAGDLAYLTSLAQVIGPGSNYWVGGLIVVDVSNPSQPTEVSRWSSSVSDAAARDTFVFADDAVLSITNAAHPETVGDFMYYTTNHFVLGRLQPNAIQVVNDLVYMATYSGGNSSLYVFDVRDPAEPLPVGEISFSGYTGALWVEGNLVYLTGYDSPLRIFEIPFNTIPAGPPVLSLSAQTGMNLTILGRRGFRYDMEYSGAVTGSNWQTFETILLTNEIAVIEVPYENSTRFFRIKQLD